MFWDADDENSTWRSKIWEWQGCSKVSTSPHMFRGSYCEHPNSVMEMWKLVYVILLKNMPLSCFAGFVVYGKYPVYCDTHTKHWAGNVLAGLVI